LYREADIGGPLASNPPQHLEGKIKLNASKKYPAISMAKKDITRFRD
jgi:hypothetical protein